MKIIKSLRVQIALAFFAVFLLISSAFAFFQFRKIKEILRSSYEEKLIIEGESLIPNEVDNPFLIPPLASDQPAQIWINELGGWELLYEHSLFPESIAEAFLSIDSDLPQDQSIVIDIDTLSLFIKKSSINESSVAERGFILAKSNTRLQEELRSIQIGLTSSIIGASLSALIVSILLANLLLKPLNQLISKTTKIKGGAQIDRLPSLKSSMEVKELSQTINEMIGRIEASIIRQNKFFDSASHELKTPLANMLAEIDYQLSSDKVSDQKKLLLSLKIEVVRLSQIVNDFLLMSQIKNDQLSIKKEPFRLDDLIYDILEKMRYQFDGKKIDLQFESMEESNLIINSDLSKMESIVVNLISNSIKYSPNVDKVIISISSRTESIHMSIENKIDAGKQFNHGNKLGLWLCKELSKKLNIQLETTKNETRFYVKLQIPTNVHSSQH